MANTFIELNDTPSDFIGQGLKFVRVNADANALVFGSVELNDLADVQANNAYIPQGGQGLIYNEAAGQWRPGSLDVYSAGNGISKSALTLNVLAGAGGGLTANTQGVFISSIANVAGTYGSDLLIPVVTVNNKGQVTNVTTRTANVQTAYNLAADYVGNVNGTSGQISVTGGRGNKSNATINLVATGVTAGTYGNSTTVPRITVDSYGRIQDIDSITISGGGGEGGGTTLGFANIVVPGQTTVSADQIEDSVTFVAGSGTTITTSANSDTITFGVDATAVANNISIADLTDVGPLTGIINGQTLLWNSINQRFQIGFTSGGGGGAATVISSETPPIGPQDATLWYDQVSGRLYIYYDGFWVDAAPASGFNANISSPTSGQVLKYNGTEWVNQNDTGGTGNIDLSAVDQDIIPDGDLTRSLGSPTHQWADLYVGNATIYLNNVPLGLDSNQNLTFNGSVIADRNGNVNISSGDYNDLTNKPAIPTDVSDLTDTTNLLGGSGTPGADGASAYDIAVDNGFVGNEAAWLASLDGEPGNDGADGQDGADALWNWLGTYSAGPMYQEGDIVKYQGSTYRRNATGNSVVGELPTNATYWEVVAERGAPGADGQDGAPGQDGADGLSAYEVAVANGFVGGESAWLASLVGEPGADGQDGAPGADGATGAQGVSVILQGTKATIADLPAAPLDPNDFAGHGWIVTADGGHLWFWDLANQEWDDVGPIVGPQGDSGADGQDGAPGQDGADGSNGASAYEIAVANGFVGNEAAWLASLVGAPGADGQDGQGVPTGGTAGQVLAKIDGDDYNTEWVNQTGSADMGNLLVTDNVMESSDSEAYINFNANGGEGILALGTNDGAKVVISTDDSGTNFEFLTDNGTGSITFPDATVQTTAFTGFPEIVADSETVPEAGVLWFNPTEARMYVKYNEQWVDASPTVLPPPDTNPEVESVTFNDNTVQTTAWPGTLSYDDLTDKPAAPAFVGGGGASTWLTAD